MKKRIIAFHCAPTVWENQKYCSGICCVVFRLSTAPTLIALNCFWKLRYFISATKPKLFLSTLKLELSVFYYLQKIEWNIRLFPNITISQPSICSQVWTYIGKKLLSNILCLQNFWAVWSFKMRCFTHSRVHIISWTFILLIK